MDSEREPLFPVLNQNWLHNTETLGKLQAILSVPKEQNQKTDSLKLAQLFIMYKQYGTDVTLYFTLLIVLLH